jgi:hypothetical protein
VSAFSFVKSFRQSSSPIRFEDTNVTDYCISNAEVNKCSAVENTCDDLDNCDQLNNKTQSNDVVTNYENEDNNASYNNNYNYTNDKDDCRNDFTNENADTKIR